MSHICRNCGKTCAPSGTKLSDWEISEVQARASDIFRARPAWKPTDGESRQHQLRQLANEYGINVRTLYRYLQRAA